MRRYRRLRAGPLFALVILSGCASPGGPLGAHASTAGAARNHEGSPFGYGKKHIGLSAGYALAIDWIGSSADAHDVRYTAVNAHLGAGITDVLADEAWYRGNLEVVGEGTFLAETEPSSGTAVGGGLLLRYNWLRSERTVPFVNLGASAMNLDFNLESQSDGIAFLLQAGFGTHFFLSRRLSLTAEWRFQHISNARINMPNNGTNASVILLGTTFFFD